jgi:hypothetical protein
MKFKSATAALSAAALLAGCASTSIGLRSTNSPSLGGAPAAGGSYSTVAINADVSPGAFFGLALLGYLAAAVQNDYRRMSGGPSWRKPPDLVEGRAIAERDCSQPLGQMEANLRCK